MTDSIAQAIASWFGSVSEPIAALITFIVSLFPILECRGGVIVARCFGLTPYLAVPISIIGNLLPIPFIFLFIEKIFDLLKNTRFHKFIDKLEEKAMSKSEKITKYKRLGLLLFVGIPLPGTGAWTGALIAVLMKMKLKESVVSIVLGVFLAAAIMTSVFYFIPWLVTNVF